MGKGGPKPDVAAIHRAFKKNQSKLISDDDPYRPRVAPECPYCGSTSHYRSGKGINGNDKRMLWVCLKYPECDSYVTCHPNSNKPTGNMGNKELRTWRRRAHVAIDRLWKTGLMNRPRVYHWLSSVMEKPFTVCHIAMFEIDECKRVVELANAKMKKLKAERA